MREPTVDCRTMPCPQPIIRLRELLTQSAPERLLTIVDNAPAVENVSRFLASKGYALEVEVHVDCWHIRATRTAEAEIPQTKTIPEQHRAVPAGTGLKTLVLIIAPVFGSGDDVLGIRLMKNFLATLPEFGEDLWRVVMLNGGVTLAAEGSPVLRELQILEESGVSILVCGACLDHFKLLEKKVVGETTNMLDVVTSIQLAEKVIRI